MKKEESSEIAFANKESSIMKNRAKDLDFSPLEELGIEVDKDDGNDEQELERIVGHILGYPCSELA